MIVNSSAKREHRSSLRRACRGHEDFFDSCIHRLQNVKKTSREKQIAFLNWLNQEITTRSMGCLETAQRLRASALALVMEQSDEETLQNLIRWNELDIFQSDRFHVGVTPELTLGCYVVPASEGEWRIETTFGYRQLVSDLLIVFWETVCQRCKLNDPRKHVEMNIDRALRGEHIVQYGAATIAQAAQTELIAAFFKMFIFSHEIGHVLIHKNGQTFSRSADEEIAADKVASEIYLAAGLTMIPPFSKYLERNEISNATQRRELAEQDPSMKQLDELGLEALIADVERWNQILSKSNLFESEKEQMAGARANALLWAVPILVFKLIERIEARLPWYKRLPWNRTHPPARDRYELFWMNYPDGGRHMRQFVERTLANYVDTMLG